MVDNTNADDGGIDYSQLYVYAGPERPDPSDMTVYEDGYFAGPDGRPIRARIIGSSHWIEYPSIGYHELTSCRPINMSGDFDPVLRRFDITEGISERIVRSVGDYEVSVSIMTMDGMDPVLDNWQISYTFEGDGPSAPTAIKPRTDGWETIHVYPEFGDRGTAVYTITEIEEVR